MRWLLALLLLPGLAFGQTPAEKRVTLDTLLQELKQAPDSESAAALEKRIQKLWIGASTAAVTLLMQRGLRELEANAYDDAIETLSAVIILDPSLAAAWHHRGIAHYESGSMGKAAADFQQALNLEPRNFAAWKTLSGIAAGREDWKQAHEAWQKVIALNPKTPDGDKRLRELKRKALGEDT